VIQTAITSIPVSTNAGIKLELQLWLITTYNFEPLFKVDDSRPAFVISPRQQQHSSHPTHQHTSATAAAQHQLALHGAVFGRSQDRRFE
jgi:hypothetical protein